MVATCAHHDPPTLADDSRFNVLLTEDRPHSIDHWTRQFPRLLKPQGVTSYLAHCGHEALGMAEKLEFHAAVIDLGTPYHAPNSASRTAHGDGLWLLQLLQRLPNRPPTVIVNSPAFSQRQIQRMLQEVLRLGVFTVINKPVALEQLLKVFRRVVDRQYRGAWPMPGPSA